MKYYDEFVMNENITLVFSSDRCCSINNFIHSLHGKLYHAIKYLSYKNKFNL